MLKINIEELIYGIHRVIASKTITGKKIYEIEVLIHPTNLDYEKIRRYFRQKKNIKNLEKEIRKFVCTNREGKSVPCINENEILEDLIEIKTTESFGKTYWKIVFTLEEK